MSRPFPHRWYVNVRLRVVDEYPHKDGWSQRSSTHRSRLAARTEFDRLRTLGGESGLDALVLDVWGRYPHTRPPERVELTFGSTGYGGKVHDSISIAEKNFEVVS